MNIKKVCLAVAAAAVVAASPLSVAPASAASGDVRGPACADIADGAGFFNESGVNLRIELAATSCRQVRYTLYVLSADGATPLATSTPTRTDSTFVFFDAVAVSTVTTSVCVYATTSVGRHIFDRAPDTGCIPLVLNGGAPAQSFR